MSRARSAALQLADAAEELVGAGFRLHGRDPETGLDCIGVLAAALVRIGRPAPFPTGYTIRTRAAPELAGVAEASGFAPCKGPVRPGDVIMVRMGPVQFHLLVAARAGQFIHAHAGLNRVIAIPGPLDWPVTGHWRLATAA